MENLPWICRKSRVEISKCDQAPKPKTADRKPNLERFVPPDLPIAPSIPKIRNAGRQIRSRTRRARVFWKNRSCRVCRLCRNAQIPIQVFNTKSRTRGRNYAKTKNYRRRRFKPVAVRRYHADSARSERNDRRNSPRHRQLHALSALQEGRTKIVHSDRKSRTLI